MKKVLSLLVAVIMISCAFAACSAKNADESSTKSTTTATVATEKAKIKDLQAADFIEKCYTPKELGLDDAEQDYSFMIASNGVQVDGKSYVKVAANVIKKTGKQNDNGEDTFTLETLGEYYISFDADRVLMKDMKTGKFKKLKNKYKEYLELQKNESQTTSTVHSEGSSAKASTTAKSTKAK